MCNSNFDLEELEAILNEDTDGQLFANFLMKKQGNVRQHRRVFRDIDNRRLSIKVRVEKVNKENEADMEVNNKKELVSTEKPTSEYDSNRKSICTVPSDEANNAINSDRLSKTPTQIPKVYAMRLSAHKSGGGLSDRLRRYSLKRASGLTPGRRALIKEFESTFDSANFLPGICSTPNTEFNALPEVDMDEVEFGSNDKTVRDSNSNETNNSKTRDTQKELESLQRKDAEILDILEQTLKRSQLEKRNCVRANVEQTLPPEKVSSSGSPLRRTYTIEKGDIPGQVVFTPQKPHSKATETESLLVKSNDKLFGTTKVYKLLNHLKSPQTSANKSKIELNTENPSAVKIISASPLQNSKSAVEFHNSIVPETQEIPCETQAVTPSIQKPITTMVVIPLYQTFNGNALHGNTNQNSDGASIPKETAKLFNSNIKKCKENPLTVCEGDKIIRNAMPDDETPKAPPTPSSGIAEMKKSVDNLRLSDILTDDEDVTMHGQNSNVPLNLAACSEKTQRTRRLRKRSTIRRRLQLETSAHFSTETECENPVIGRPLNLRRPLKSRDQESSGRRSHMLKLNKPPSHPINGEEFALELERMSYNEILDLRKRNSMGKIFSIKGRRSSASRNVMNQQETLEKNIEFELRRRESISGIDKKMGTNKENHNVYPQVYDEREVDAERSQLPQAPDGFNDIGTQQRVPGEGIITNNIECDDDPGKSLTVENNGSVSFIPPQPKLSSSNSANHKRRREMSDTLKNYLEASTRLKKKPKKLHQSKRPLYSKGNSDSEETDSPPLKKTATTFVPPAIPSPPRGSTNNEITEIRIVSPPPPLNLIPTTEYTRSNEEIISECAPPPLLFSDDIPSTDIVSSGTKNCSEVAYPISFLKTSEKSPKNKIASSNESNEYSLRYLGPIRSPPLIPSINSINDDEKFKKPTGRPPKSLKSGSNKNSTKKKEHKTSKTTITTNGRSNDSIFVCIENSTNNSFIRRSKRGHVPIKETNAISYLQKMYETAMQKSRENYQKRVDKIKKQKSTLGANSKAQAPLASSTAVSHTEADETGTSQKRNRVLNRKTLRLRQQREMVHYTVEKEKKTTNTNVTTDRLYSLLGDTNCTTASTRLNAPFRRPVSPIYENDSDHHEINSSQDPIKDNLLTKSIKETHKLKNKQCKSSPKKIVTKNKKDFEEKISAGNQLLPAPINELNTIFDQLKNAGLYEQGNSKETVGEPFPQFSDQQSNHSDAPNVLTTNQRKLRIRLKRFDSSATQTSKEENCTNRVSVENTLAKSGELLTWLKCVADNPTLSARNQKLFTEMHISSAGNLLFTEVEGIDYAFYDTERRASLGYLRFKPRQIKPSKRAKTFHLHFVVLAGEFKFGTNNEEGSFRSGDMVAINKGVRYSIENTTDDIGLLMVIKK